MAGIDELQAVNFALTVGGGTRVTTIDSTRPDVLGIRILLDEARRNLLVTGWWFNREYDLVLAPDPQGRILLPQNMLAVDSTDRIQQFVQRGNIGESVTIDSIILLPFSDCPYTAQRVIQFEATMLYVGGEDGDDREFVKMERRFNLATAELKREHLRASDITVRSNPMITRIMGRRLARNTSRFGANN
jgi:hypothetical protein